MKSRKRESAAAPGSQSLSGRLWNWAQSLYDRAHDPAHCARCGVYLPERNRICGPCAREGQAQDAFNSSAGQ